MCVFTLAQFIGYMSVHNGRHLRRLMPPELAFREASRQKTMKPAPTFGKLVVVSLVGIITGTLAVTVGILMKQTVLIISGFTFMCLTMLGTCVSVYS